MKRALMVGALAFGLLATTAYGKRKYNEATVTCAQMVLAVEKAKTLDPVLRFFTSKEQSRLKKAQREWLEKQRRTSKTRNRKKSRLSEQFNKSPYERKLFMLKGLLDNVIDLEDQKQSGSKATVVVVTRGDFVVNNNKLHCYETVHMVKQRGTWRYDRIVQGKYGYTYDR